MRPETGLSCEVQLDVTGRSTGVGHDVEQRGRIPAAACAGLQGEDGFALVGDEAVDVDESFDVGVGRAALLITAPP